jgi:hypothetical protein
VTPGVVNGHSCRRWAEPAGRGSGCLWPLGKRKVSDLSEFRPTIAGRHLRKYSEPNLVSDQLWTNLGQHRPRSPDEGLLDSRLRASRSRSRSSLARWGQSRRIVVGVADGLDLSTRENRRTRAQPTWLGTA